VKRGVLGKSSGTASGILTMNVPDRTRGRYIKTYWCGIFFF